MKREELIKLLKENISIARPKDGPDYIRKSTYEDVADAILKFLASHPEPPKAESGDKNCNDTCKWWKIGYGHCEWCIRCSSRNKTDPNCKDNYESLIQSSDEAKETEYVKGIDKKLQIEVAKFLKNHPHTGSSFAFCQGYKYAEQYHKERTRKEWIRFASYNFKEALRVNYDMEQIVLYVDEYLKDK